MNCSLQVSSVHGVFQVRILKGVAISFSKGSSQPRDRTHVFFTGRWIQCDYIYTKFLFTDLKKINRLNKSKNIMIKLQPSA